MKHACLGMILALTIGCGDDDDGNGGAGDVDASLANVDAASGGNADAVPADADVYEVHFETTKGDVIVEVNRLWAPLGADRFRALVEAGFYDDVRFFRVVPGFVVQFGMSGDPAVNSTWSNNPINDDPVVESNTLGMLTFATAGPNTRTSQLFINLADNSFLDSQGFSPFARVAIGMDVVATINDEYGEQPQQPRIASEGNFYLDANFPNLDGIVRACVGRCQ